MYNVYTNYYLYFFVSKKKWFSLTWMAVNWNKKHPHNDTAQHNTTRLLQQKGWSELKYSLWCAVFAICALFKIHNCAYLSYKFSNHIHYTHIHITHATHPVDDATHCKKTGTQILLLPYRPPVGCYVAAIYEGAARASDSSCNNADFRLKKKDVIYFLLNKENARINK